MNTRRNSPAEIDTQSISTTATLTVSAQSVVSPPETPPTEEETRAGSLESSTAFESAAFAEMHDRQEAFEIDRRKQERSAKENELATMD